MLQTLRAYGAQRLTEAGEQPAAAAKLAAYALKLADQAARGLQTSPGERAAAIWLDAEDATVHQALAWALEHDLDTALSLTVALAPWWWLRSRDAAGSALLSRAAEHAQEGGKQWCEARLWLGRLTMMSGPASLSHSTAVRDALTGGPASPMLAWTLAERAGCLANLGQLPEAAAEASRALALAKEIGDSANQARTLYWLGGIAHYAGNCKEAVAWLRQAQQIDPASIP